MYPLTRAAIQRVRQKGSELLAGGLAVSGLSFLMAFGVATILILLAGFDVVRGYETMLKGAFGSPVAIGDVLARSTPLVFTGLSVAIAFRSGLFNVGAEGQLLLGAMAAALVGLIPGLPAVLHIPLAFSAAALTGALIGTVPAYLKARFGAHEVITTLMLNYVVILFTGYLANYPFHPLGELSPATAKIAASAELPRLIQGSQFSPGIFIAVGAAILFSVILNRSVIGYEIRAVGFNSQAAAAKGIKQARSWMIALGLAGAAAGLGGAGEVLAVHRRFIVGFSPGYGFDGIAVALMAQSNPLGTIPAALLLGAIRTGALVMDQTTKIPGDFVTVIQGLVLVFLAAPGLFQLLRRRHRPEDTSPLLKGAVLDAVHSRSDS
ncbi:MAG: ABC transporter permease [Chloroflexi bacterium]|nr:ABC transporter permease [Chloroflexota bacterium]